MNDIILNKVQSIQRRIRRAREEHSEAGANFSEDFTRQDAAVLNITRACEQAIDLANHLIKTRRLGVPAASGDSFELLAREGLIDSGLAARLKKMVGFRNIAVHEYQELKIAIVEAIIGSGLDDLAVFSERLGRLA